MRWGLTNEEGARRTREVRSANRMPHPWFAWRPVRLECGRWGWLEVVMRHSHHAPGRFDFPSCEWWVFRAI